MMLADATTETWRLQTHWTWAPWFTLVFLLAAIALVIGCYRSEASPAGAMYRAILGLLRMTTVVLLLLMLSEAVFSGARTGKPRLAIVVDRSESMQREDVRPSEGSPTTRLAAATGLLTRDEGELLRRLESSYQIELALSDTTTQTVAGGAEEILDTLASLQESANAAPSSTRLGDGVAGMMQNVPGAPLQGLLLLTDGQITAGRSLDEAAEAARRSGAPLYIVGIGSETPPPEARLTDLIADDTAFADDLVALGATLNTRGLTGKQVRVELLRSGQSEPIAREDYAIDQDAPTVSVRLLDRPTEANTTVRYRLRATVIGEEGIAPSELSHAVLIRDSKIRVLLAAGTPCYEFRFLKYLLERDETIALSHHLQQADPEYAESDRTAIGQMPLMFDDLVEYEVVVLMDLDPAILPRSFGRELGKFVGERGGGLVLVAGPSSLPRAYRSWKDFAALAPTEISASAFGGYYEPGGYQVAPTPLGAQQTSLQLGDTPAQSERIWRSLAPLYWRADIGPPKPAAQVLAHHPTARTDDGAPAPLIVSHYFGAGRVLLHAIDSTYRWRSQIGDAYFARYWVQTLRSLARDKRSEAAAAIELMATKPRYAPGETIRLRLRDQRPGTPSDAAPAVLLQSPGRPDQRVELAPREAGRRFETALRNLPPGRYRALLAGEAGQPVTTEFEVVAPLGEEAHPEMNRAGLAAAAEHSRGVFLAYEEVDSLRDLIPPGRPTALETLPPRELWNRWPLLAAITGCLTLEWILRKRRSML